MEHQRRHPRRSSIADEGPKWLDEFVKKLKHYGKDTSLHGFHHITDEKSSYLKRLTFIIVCGFSIIFCIYLIWLQLHRYETNIVTTSLISTAYPVWEVPFPSVIICSYNMVYKSNTELITKSLKFSGVPEATLKDFFLNLSSLVVFDDFLEVPNYTAIFKNLDRSGYNIDSLMKQLATPCESMLKKCYWKTNEVPCLNLFKLVKTNYGYCCGFNQKGFDDEEDTTVSSNNHEYTGGAGPAFGLRLLLDAEESQYFSSIKPVVGFSVAVMASIVYPQMELYGNSLLPADEMTIYLKPSVIESSHEVRQLNVNTRQCLLENEGNLRWNRRYSFHTCILECKAKAIQQLCNCLPFYYPYKASETLCSFENIPCLRQNEYKYNSIAVKATTKDKTDARKLTPNLKEVTECNCYPGCDESTYDYYIDTAKATPVIGYNYTNISILNVYFKNIVCTKMQRTVYLTWDSLLASIGGIFGLCLGGSVLSMIECFYYLFKCSESSIRSVVKKNNNNKVNNWKQQRPSDKLFNATLHHYKVNGFPQRPQKEPPVGKKAAEFLYAFRE